ncbi:polygalacturonase inhibitor 1-like [Ananas comosus]|uniref:Polygalacturonase inhibitor 1-like n=1 Tax=Ananas comosus TaxID=4615 RepID=A0A6P5GNW5_ANACO|nr:polygalacturonase inhibitor 1-like [Ananas comosus]
MPNCTDHNPNSSSFLFLIFLFLFFVSVSLSSSLDCNAGDRATLLKIKDQLGNPPELASWQPGFNCCSWNAIECSESGRVYLVAFFRLTLQASSVPVPAALGDLPFLRTIQLDTIPGLAGPIPSSFSKLSQLEILDVESTNVSGPIPAFLSRTNLSALILSNSNFSGPIPTALASLPNLRYLDLSGNRLSGQIPPGLLHGTFRFLILSDNQLSGEIPKDYGEGDIDTVDLSHNELTGDASFLLGITKPATKLDLSWNELAFDLTRVMVPHGLTYLDLSHNRIKGRVPKSLKDVRLHYLNLTYNELCGEIPTGRFMVYHKADSYLHNKCLCGTPLPACRRLSRKILECNEHINDRPLWDSAPRVPSPVKKNSKMQRAY